MKSIYIVSLFLCISITIKAQDTVYFLKQGEAVSKISTQKIDSIKLQVSGMPKNSFFLFGNDGNIITISNSSIDSICFNLPVEVLSKYIVLEIPTNLQVNYALGSGLVSFMWDGTESEFELKVGSITYPVIGNSHTLSNLALDAYNWKVRSIKEGKGSLWIDGTPFKTIVDPPFNLTLDLNTLNSRTVYAWSGSADSFEVRIKRKYLKEKDTTYTYFVNGNSYTKNQILAGEYTWSVRAINENVKSKWVDGKRFAMGNEVTVADMDGNLYPIMVVGEQQWLRENLRVTKLNDGTSLPNLADPIAWGNTENPAYCWYDNDSSSYYKPYGALYNWQVVLTDKICPAGWRIPRKEEWKTFSDSYKVNPIDVCEFTPVIDNPIKKAGGDDIWCFLGGSRVKNSTFNHMFGKIKVAGFWWFYETGLQTEFISFDHTIPIIPEYGVTTGLAKNDGYSIRCIKDGN